jgi:hypothetical protein
MKNSDLRSVLSSLIDLAESGDVRGTSFGSRAAGPLLGLLAHNVAKASKSAPADVASVETPADASASVETPADASASVETASVSTSARGSRVRASAS